MLATEIQAPAKIREVPAGTAPEIVKRIIDEDGGVIISTQQCTSTQQCSEPQENDKQERAMVNTNGFAPTTYDADVIVIGAGISGSAAAKSLHDQGEAAGVREFAAKAIGDRVFAVEGLATGVHRLDQRIRRIDTQHRGVDPGKRALCEVFGRRAGADREAPRGVLGPEPTKLVLLDAPHRDAPRLGHVEARAHQPHQTDRFAADPFERDRRVRGQPDHGKNALPSPRTNS